MVKSGKTYQEQKNTAVRTNLERRISGTNVADIQRNSEATLAVTKQNFFFSALAPGFPTTAIFFYICIPLILIKWIFKTFNQNTGEFKPVHKW